MVNRDKLAEQHASLAKMLPDGYRTAHFGKWHLGDDLVRQHGFHEWVSTGDDHRDRIRELAARIRLRQVETGDDAPLPAV